MSEPPAKKLIKHQAELSFSEFDSVAALYAEEQDERLYIK